MISFDTNDACPFHSVVDLFLIRSNIFNVRQRNSMLIFIYLFLFHRFPRFQSTDDETLLRSSANIFRFVRSRRSVPRSLSLRLHVRTAVRNGKWETNCRAMFAVTVSMSLSLLAVAKQRTCTVNENKRIDLRETNNAPNTRSVFI